ncbi:MAG TPA: hypothetical protein VFS29_08035 [Motilibacteraceae bacterium]|nr:hypothetical protein [Motilibacteraceae bacterium]
MTRQGAAPWLGQDPLHGLRRPSGDPEQVQQVARHYAAAGDEAARQAAALRALGTGLARAWEGPGADAARGTLADLGGRLSRTGEGAHRAAAAWAGYARALRAALQEWDAARSLADTALAEEARRAVIAPTGAPVAALQPSPQRARATRAAYAALSSLERADRQARAALADVLRELPDPDAVAHLLQKASTWAGYALAPAGAASGGVKDWQRGLEAARDARRADWDAARARWRATGTAAARAELEQARDAGKAARLLARTHAAEVLDNGWIKGAGKVSGAAGKVMPAAGFALDVAAGEDPWQAGTETVLSWGAGRAAGMVSGMLIGEGVSEAALLGASLAIPVVGEVAIVAVLGVGVGLAVSQVLTGTEVGQDVTHVVADAAKTTVHALGAAWGWVTG